MGAETDSWSNESRPVADPTPIRLGPTARAYGIVRRNDEILLVRASALTRVQGLWWLPGGGIDFGESPEEAVIREIREETGLRATNPRLREIISDTWTRSSGEEMHALRIIFDVDVTDGELTDERDGTTDRAEWKKISELDDLLVADYVRRVVRDD